MSVATTFQLSACLIFSLMPWIQLERSKQLFVAQAADVIVYQNRRRNNKQSSWEPIKTFRGHHGDVSKFVIAGDQLVTCSVDNSVRTWSLQTAECDGLFHGHTGGVHSVDCFDDVIVTGSRDKTVKVMISIYLQVCCKIPSISGQFFKKNKDISQIPTCISAKSMKANKFWNNFKVQPQVTQALW